MNAPALRSTGHRRHDWRPEPRDWRSPLSHGLGHGPEGQSPLSVWIGDVENGYGEGYQLSVLIWGHLSVFAAVIAWAYAALDNRWLLPVFLATAVVGFALAVSILRDLHRRRRHRDRVIAGMEATSQ